MSFLRKIAKVALVLFLIEVVAIILFAGVVYYANQSLKNNQTTTINEMQNSVFQVYSIERTATCFAVRDSSGQIKLLTNRHFCDTIRSEVPISVRKNFGDVIFTATIEKMSTFVDLCLLTPSSALIKSGVQPLQLGMRPYPNEPVSLVGYPLYNVMTVSYGYTKTLRKLILPWPLPPAACNFGNFTVINTKSLLGNQMALPFPPTICVLNTVVLGTTVPNDAGGSGSPLFNNDGEVIGILSAVEGRQSWAQTIPIEYVKKFIGVQ